MIDEVNFNLSIS